MQRACVVALLLTSSTIAHAEDESPPLSIYGFARLDILANDSRMSSLDQPEFVEREPAAGQLDSAMTMTPRLSRIGISIDEWDVTDRMFKGDGKLEVDFGGAGDGTSAIRLRHAYASINMKHRVELLAGQTIDLISPLFPAAQNDTQLRYAGNLGDRRPQLRLSMLPTNKLTVAVAAAAKGVLDQTDMDHDGQIDAMASAKPMLQWLVEARLPGIKQSTIRIGFSGHAGSSELADRTSIGSSSVGMHFFAPWGQRLILLGEGYVGKNMAELGGGIGQGVNPMTTKPIHSAGGWLELATFPTKRHMLALGASGDSARASDLEIGDRETNSTVYGVLRYKPRPALQLGLEYLHWRTGYKEMSDGQANRFDMHFSVFF
ncbi:MAG: hypothetical protein ABI867_18110 [Kofleriaceae bacterium]